MRPIAISGILSTTLVAACGLGVVDVAPEPAPARLWVTSTVAPYPGDSSRVQTTVHARLDPGIDRDGTPRRVASDLFQVEDCTYTPQPGDEERPHWRAETSFPAPWPEGVRLGLPQVAGLGLAQSLSMRVRVETTPVGPVRLAEGEDLVVGAEPPSNPAADFEWSLVLTSPSAPDYRWVLRGSESWPTEVRVPASEIPASALPVQAILRIRWDRSLDLVDLGPVDRYELNLESFMVVVWTVTRAE